MKRFFGTPCMSYPTPPYGPVTLGRIDLTYKKRALFINVLFDVLFMPCYYPPNAFVLGDVHFKYIPVRCYFSVGLVISAPDKIFLYTAMYVGIK